MSPSSTSSEWLRDALDQRTVLVTLGSGGVGKTTLAATLALQAALRGRRCLVLTIDPARRLATALGLEALLPTPQRVPLDGLAASAAGGELWAMMLDAGQSFDALVRRHASSPEAQERITQHRLYRHMSEALAGTHDLAALEQLHDLHQQARYDLIVLDTPPKEHAFDFLDAPARFAGLLAQSRLRWLLEPMADPEGVGGLRHLTARLIVRTLSGFTGPDVLRDLATLTLALFDLGQGIEERAQRVEALLAGGSCGFFVVTRPDPMTVAEALGQHSKLRAKGFPFAGFLVNRCHALPASAPAADAGDALPAALAERLRREQGVPLERGLPLVTRLLEALELLRRTCQREAETLARLEQAWPPELAASERHLLRVPELDEEVHTVAQVLRFGERLLGGQGEQAQGSELEGACVALSGARAVEAGPPQPRR